MSREDNDQQGGQSSPAQDESEDALRLLGAEISDPGLKSSTRILILFSLALNSRLGFGDLLGLTGMGKGSLNNHLEKLEASGLIRTKMRRTLNGPRLIVEITEKGREAYDNLVSAIGRLQRKSEGSTVQILNAHDR